MKTLITVGIFSMAGSFVMGQSANFTDEFYSQIAYLVGNSNSDFKGIPINYKLEGAITGKFIKGKNGHIIYKALLRSNVNQNRLQAIEQEFIKKIDQFTIHNYHYTEIQDSKTKKSIYFENNSSCHFDRIVLTIENIGGSNSISLAISNFDTKQHHYNIDVSNSPTKSENLKKAKEIIVDKLGVDPKEVVYEAYFVKDLGADSLDCVELVMEFEKEFDINIPDDIAEKFCTVGDVMLYLEDSVKN